MCIRDRVTALKEAVDIPIQLHTHYTSGVASMTYIDVYKRQGRQCELTVKKGGNTG